MAFEDRYIPEPMSGCWLWLGYVKRTPSPNYMLPWAGYKGKPQSAARVSWLRYKGEIPEGMHVLHTCHNCYCVNPNHLYLGTHQDNMLDMIQTKRGAGGSGSLAPHIENMKRMRENGLNNVEIAKALGCHHKSVSRILNGGHFRDSFKAAG